MIHVDYVDFDSSMYMGGGINRLINPLHLVSKHYTYHYTLSSDSNVSKHYDTDWGLWIRKVLTFLTIFTTISHFHMRADFQADGNGTVCDTDNRFTDEAATVICKAMGYKCAENWKLGFSLLSNLKHRLQIIFHPSD